MIAFDGGLLGLGGFADLGTASPLQTAMPTTRAGVLKGGVTKVRDALGGVAAKLGPLAPPKSTQRRRLLFVALTIGVLGGGYALYRKRK